MFWKGTELHCVDVVNQHLLSPYCIFSNVPGLGTPRMDSVLEAKELSLAPGADVSIVITQGDQYSPERSLECWARKEG